MDPCSKEPDHRGRRRTDLQRSDRRARVVYTADRHCSRRNAGRQGISDRCDHPQNLGATGVTGTPGANRLAREADLVIGIGTRYSDFTTASKTAFQNPGVRFININVADVDAFKHAGLPLVADARVILEELSQALQGYRVSDSYSQRVDEFPPRVGRRERACVQRTPWSAHQPGRSNWRCEPVLAREGRGGVRGRESSGDLHKLWNTRDPKGYHLEYGYSCMGYELPAGLA